MLILHEDGTRTRASTRSLLDELERDGLVVIEDLLSPEDLAAAQFTFDQAASTLAWNTEGGFFQTDPYRRIVNDVLRLDDSIVRAVTHPLVLDLARSYLGPEYILTEAKGWRSRVTRHNFHGWHNDAWYERSLVEIPRQIKLAVYLTDVQTGVFEYTLGSHLRHSPSHFSDAQARAEGRTRRVSGKAGTAFLFDSSGIHRQSTPILEERDALFVVYHDPAIPLQQEDLAANRYHPLLLNAATLGGLDEEQQRALGIGSTALHRRGYRPEPRALMVQQAVQSFTSAYFSTKNFANRVQAKVRTFR